MIRPLVLVLFAALVCAVPFVPTKADDPPKKLTPEEIKSLESSLRTAMMSGVEAYQKGKVADAIKTTESAVGIARQLYPKGEYPNGHPNLAQCLNNLGIMYWEQSRGDAEPLWKEALEMNRRLWKDDHPSVAAALNNLANLYWSKGKLAEAEPLRKEALAVMKRLVEDRDHPDVATCLTNLGALYRDRDKLAEAETAFKDALAMRKRLAKDKDSADVAGCMIDLAGAYQKQKKPADARALYRDALAMYRRTFKGADHPDFAHCLNNFAVLLDEQDEPADAEPLYREAVAMRKRLFKGRDHPELARSLKNLGNQCVALGKLNDAELLYKDALAMRQRIYKDHADVAASLQDLAVVYQQQARWAEAEPLYAAALAMRKRLHKDADHTDVARSMTGLATLYEEQGRLTEAEALHKDALAMVKRLHKDGLHPDVATSLGHLAAVYHRQSKKDAAEPLYKETLALCKRLFPGDAPALASAMSGLATFYFNDLKLAEAEPLYRDALAMYRRLPKSKSYTRIGHTMGNLALVCQFQGKWAEAEALYKELIDHNKRTFQNRDHVDAATGLNNLATLYLAQGKLTEAAATSKEALDLFQRLTRAYAKHKSEGETLTLLRSQPHTRDVHLSVARARAAGAPDYDPAATYPVVWSAKGYVARAYERRHFQARSADPKLAAVVSELAVARGQRAEMLLAPVPTEPGALERTKADLRANEERITALSAVLARDLPPVARLDKLDAATPRDLQAALPADAAVVDFVRYTRYEFDTKKAPAEQVKMTPHYAAFVVTRGTVAWADLGAADGIEPAVEAWRAAITAGTEIDPKVPGKVRAAVWEPVRKHLPVGTKTVFVCPDAALCTLPFAALPGDKPGTIVLEDFALATIPHAPFLLDRLWPQDRARAALTTALAVGGIDYASERAPADTPRGRTALLKPAQQLGWAALPNTVGELNGIARAALSRKLTVVRVEGEKATTAAVREALPKAQVAHFATHGFFADPSLRSALQLDEGEFQQTQWGERRGRIANSPLVMTGLVCAGSNHPKTPGRGILTGEQLVDLDLAGLELAVLSACETGLGDHGLPGGGEGVFGLQRAFHYAGAKNVVASLWKVPDAPTAALMNQFYVNLWDKNLPPIEALRQAQLHIYRNPGDIPELAKGFRGKFEEVKGAGAIAAKPQGGKAHPLLWAAFSLSGTGK